MAISVSAPPRNDPPPSAADVERARGPARPGLISTERENRIRYRLTLFRDHIVEELKIPFVTAEMILPDPVLEDIVNNVKHIVTLQQLHWTMEKHHFHVRRSLLSEENVKRMMVMIDMAMTERIEWTTPRLSVDTSIRHYGKQLMCSVHTHLDRCYSSSHPIHVGFFNPTCNRTKRRNVSYVPYTDAPKASLKANQLPVEPCNYPTKPEARLKRMTMLPNQRDGGSTFPSDFWISKQS